MELSRPIFVKKTIPSLLCLVGLIGFISCTTGTLGTQGAVSGGVPERPAETSILEPGGVSFCKKPENRDLPACNPEDRDPPMERSDPLIPAIPEAEGLGELQGLAEGQEEEKELCAHPDFPMFYLDCEEVDQILLERNLEAAAQDGGVPDPAGGLQEIPDLY